MSIAAKHDKEWIRCGECGAKMFKIVKCYYNKDNKPPPNCCIEMKCKAKHNGKTCNSLNLCLL